MDNSSGKQDSLNVKSALDFLRAHWELPVLLASLLYVLWPVLRIWWGDWNKDDSYYSHGPLVPFIAAFMVWSSRRTLAVTKYSPSWWGVALVACAVPVHVLSILLGVKAIFPFSFYLIMIGLILMLWGRSVLKAVLAPLAFLITMIPFAEWSLDAMTAKAQLLSAAVAELFLRISGYDVIRYGNQINCNDLPHPLLVGSPCSGLRLLISLITFSWFFTYVIDGPRWKKVVLMVLSVPLAVFINSLRITMIGYAGFWTGSGEAMTTFHDYSGYIGLVICFVILFGIARLMKMRQFISERPPANEAVRPTPAGRSRSKIALVLVVAGMLVVAGICATLVKPLYDLPKGKIPRSDIPVAFGTWASKEVPIAADVKEILNLGDLMSRVYVDHGDSGRMVEVFLDASLDVTSFHDPHLCLPGGGNMIGNEREVSIKFTKPRPITVRAISLESSSDYEKTLIIWWYMLGDRSFAWTQELADLRRDTIKRDVVSLVSNPLEISELRADILSRQIIWYRFSTTMVTEDAEDEQFLTGFIKEYIAKHGTFGQ